MERKSTQEMSHDELIVGSLSITSGAKIHTELALRNIAALNSVAEKIEAAAQSNNGLSSRIFWLNVILVIATVVMAGLAFADRFWPIE